MTFPKLLSYIFYWRIGTSFNVSVYCVQKGRKQPNEDFRLTVVQNRQIIVNYIHLAPSDFKKNCVENIIGYGKCVY